MLQNTVWVRDKYHAYHGLGKCDLDAQKRDCKTWNTVWGFITFYAKRMTFLLI